MGFLEALLFSLEVIHGTAHAIRDNPNFKEVCHDRIGIFGRPLKNSDGTIKQQCKMVKKTQSELSDDAADTLEKKKNHAPTKN